MNFPQYQIDNLSADMLNELKEKYHIDFTIHVAEDIDVAHFNPYIRAAYLKTIKKVVEIMKQSKLMMMNMHMSKGIYVTLPTEKVFIYKKYLNQYLHNLRNFTREFESYVGDSGIRLGVENTGILDVEHIVLGTEVLLESNFIGLTLDVGHDYSSDFKDSHFYEKHKATLIHMHLHDTIERSNHLTLNTGEVAIEQFVSQAEEHNAAIVLEIKTCESLGESVSYLEEIGVIG